MWARSNFYETTLVSCYFYFFIGNICLIKHRVDKKQKQGNRFIETLAKEQEALNKSSLNHNREDEI